MEILESDGDVPHRNSEEVRSHWYLSKDGDATLLAFYDRHYSARKYKDGRQRKLFCGPGEKIVLSTRTGDAGFVWRNFIDASGQEGINCAFFRNESNVQASDLIRQADAVADCVWPGQRHYTYVNPQRVWSANPGCCFKRAGGRRCGVTRGGLLIFERSTARRAGKRSRGAW